MSDRGALLRAIQSHPSDDTVRLAYADWLDEFGDRPADAATAEFIRVACPGAGVKLRQTYAEGRWLRANWERLVPALVERGVALDRREGRWVNARVIDRVQFRGHKSEVSRWVRLEFWRGLVRAAKFSNAENALELLPHLLADQPLAVPVLLSLRYDERTDDGGPYVLIDDHALGGAAGALRGFDGTAKDDEHAAVFRDRNLVGASTRARKEVRAALLRKAWALHDEFKREREGAPV